MAGHYNQYISGLTLTGIIILLLGCHERTKVQSSERIITDPYHQSFWGKGIEMMIKEDSTDTTFFDKAGNMIRSSSRFGSSQARFDESHRLVRMIRHDDTSGNYLYKYDTAVNVIMQLGNKILSTNWDYDSTDVDRTIPFRILYVFDEKNRMINEINARDGYFLFHRYDDALRRESLRYEHTTKMVTE